MKMIKNKHNQQYCMRDKETRGTGEAENKSWSAEKIKDVNWE